MMENEAIIKQVREIKQSFRLLMNGVASHSMREKGLNYKLNWGISLVDLKEMAGQHVKNLDLAIALWKEDVRECKMLAILLMPHEAMPPEQAELWVEQLPSLELAEQASFHLFRHLKEASVLAYKWIALDDELPQICGYHVLGGLFQQGRVPDERGVHEFFDQVGVVLRSGSIPLKHAAMNAVYRFADIDKDCERVAENMMKSMDVEIF